jgi:hypothetical protein
MSSSSDDAGTSVFGGTKGFIKLDLLVLSKGDKAPVHKDEVEADDDIDK